jgi:hypothetical protein
MVGELVCFTFFNRLLPVTGKLPELFGYSVIRLFSLEQNPERPERSRRIEGLAKDPERSRRISNITSPLCRFLLLISQTFFFRLRFATPFFSCFCFLPRKCPLSGFAALRLFFRDSRLPVNLHSPGPSILLPHQGIFFLLI